MGPTLGPRVNRSGKNRNGSRPDGGTGLGPPLIKEDSR